MAANLRFAAHPFHLRAERLNGFVRLLVSGELDLDTARYLEESLVHLQQERATIIVDLADLTFMSAQGLSIFMAAAKRARSTRGVIVILNCNGPVRRVFELTSTLDLLDASVVSELFDDDRDWTPVPLTRVEPLHASSVSVR
jgi:anti-sigma B factor antagonist